MRIRFDRFVLDSATRLLERDGRDVHVSPKAFDLLAILLAERPGVVTKDVLRDRLWGGTNVVDANLNNLVSEIRAALDDEPQQSRFVRTVHRVGYAFCGEAAAEDAATADATVCWLAWGGRTIGVTVGETIIGRDPGSGIWIDAPGVSRRHACVRVQRERRRRDRDDRRFGQHQRHIRRQHARHGPCGARRSAIDSDRRRDADVPHAQQGQRSDKKIKRKN